MLRKILETPKHALQHIGNFARIVFVQVLLKRKQLIRETAMSSREL